MQLRSRVLPVLVCALLLIAFVPGRTSLLAKPRAPQTGSELNKVDVWAGHWTTQGESMDSAFSSAGKLSSDMTCAWSPYHGYMMCDQLIDSPNGKMNSLSVYTYSEKENAFKFYGLDKDGMPRSTAVTVKNTLWTYTGSFESKGKKIDVRTMNIFMSADKVLWHTEYSDDGGQHWVLMNQGSDTRVK
jgi:hypothetical protein